MANILVFDSGMGGLTVYGEIRRTLPAHNYFYCFDNAHFPYGELSEPELISACTGLVSHMVAEHAIDLRASTFYTDSISDLPMLERVGRPVAVNPDPRLAVLARRRGWPALRW